MKIIIERLSNAVIVNSVGRYVDLSSLDLAIVEVHFDTSTNNGKVIYADREQGLGRAAFNNLYAKYWQIWVAGGTTPTRTLEQVKTDKREQINSIRDNLEQNGFPYMEKVIDSNPVSVQRITVAVQAAQAAIGAGQPFAITWTCQDNSTLELDAVGMMGMPVALAMFANTLHETARTKKELIDSATSIEEVEAVTWA